MAALFHHCPALDVGVCALRHRARRPQDLLGKLGVAGRRLDPRAFDVAIRASDSGLVSDDNKLRQVVESALSASELPVALAEITFTIQDGRLHVDATTLEAQGARAKISGGYDLPADQADIRVTLTSTTQGTDGARPEVQLFTVGSPDKLNRTVDVSPLSRWL